MLRLSKWVLITGGLFGLMACGIPPVETKLISDWPADARSFAVAQKAAKACVDPTDREKVRRLFRRAGFGVAVQKITLRSGRKIDRTTISSPDPAVSVLYHGGSCYVGLAHMTPEQSSKLAGIWVRAHDAKSNSDLGEGLSDHASGAWRHFFVEPARFPDKAAYAHRIYIAAYKTWPHGPYDPQRNIPFDIRGTFPEKPGAAIKLSHVIECRPNISTGISSGAFLPCSGSVYEPK